MRSASSSLCEVRSDRGLLRAGYHLAARLSGCKVIRANTELNQHASVVEATVTWVDPYWSTQPSSFVVVFSQAEWVWKEAHLSGDWVPGGRVQGVVIGDPIAQPRGPS